MGLLWLESHFASVFGNESGWNDDEDLSIDCAEVWELYQAGEFCGLGLNDWTTKTGDDEAYFGRYLLFEDVFATFARFEDVGLLWLDSHFARVFGNESGWSDWPFECNIAKFWQQIQAVMVYIYLIRVDKTFQYGFTGSALLDNEWRQFRAAFLIYGSRNFVIWSRIPPCVPLRVEEHPLSERWSRAWISWALTSERRITANICG